MKKQRKVCQYFPVFNPDDFTFKYVMKLCYVCEESQTTAYMKHVDTS